MTKTATELRKEISLLQAQLKEVESTEKAAMIKDAESKFETSTKVLEFCENGISEWEEVHTVFHNNDLDVPDVISWRDDFDLDELQEQGLCFVVTE